MHPHLSNALLLLLLSLSLSHLTLTMASSGPKPQHFDGTRLTTHSAQNFSTVTARLYNELGSPSALQYPAIVKNITSYNATSKAQYVAAIERAVGPHGFMLFQEFNHGLWLPLFGLSVNLGLKRLILGNPLVAETMLQYDLTAGLFVPVELLVRERSAGDGGGVDLVWVLPSSLIAGVGENEDLLKAAKVLDEKLKALVEFVAA